MDVLVINCGSTSIKMAVVDPHSGKRLSEAKIERLDGAGSGQLFWDGADQPEPCPADHTAALGEVLPRLIASGGFKVAAVGHRVVHGGSLFSKPTLLDEATLRQIDQLSDLAPLHNPANAAGIRAATRLLDAVPHVAVFDTAFHSTLPRRASTYALPQDLREKHGIRRYGFHGTSHQFVARQAAQFLGEPLEQLRLITCHLGGGCSMCAVEYGRSIETSMGMTPLEGLVMGTRSGDVDPGGLLHWMRSQNASIDEADALLNSQSGLLGLSGIGSDMRDIEQAAEEGDDRCRLALQVFCHRVRKYIGAYTAVMGGVDAIVLTGGIGQNSITVRHRLGQRLDYLGARMDEVRTREASVCADRPVAAFSTEHSRVKLLIAATDETRAIAQQTVELVQAVRPQPAPKAIRSPSRHAMST